MNAPQGLRHIHHDLVVRIAAAALFLGLLAGGGAYLIESRRVEASARAMVETAVRHFQAPVMQMLDRGLRNDDHREVEELFRWSNLVGLRVHDANGETIYEAWGTLPESTRAQLRTLPATPLAVATDWHEWLPPETALAILERDAGKHFDPAMVRIFKTIARRLHGELSATYEADLHRRLQAAIDEYFFASSPQPANMTAM